MYITPEQARNIEILGVSDTAIYSDNVLTSLIKKAQSIVDSYIGQTLELTPPSGETANVLCTPDMEAGLFIKLPRRYINEVLSVSIEYDYNCANLVLNPDQYFVAKDEGFIHSNIGASYPLMFENDRSQQYKASVIYVAGFNLLPDD
jgi:hypothetical protein